ncbi:hypothetical protein TCAL_03813 [Tigriopus californicus]|uniref:Uncharacterized protein n=1 Tax=Tigriopus californicus TaxID=6832 RepID=A0A553NTN0_TIGCA|nr:uncharacterized protein LOC131880550 [Tigriopus californicus]TRY68778.1 hypothetical protein TCAL_03813 [Tigriopus californicus]
MCTSTLGIVCPQTCCMKFNLRQGIFIIVAVRSVIYLITIIVTLKPFYQSVEEPLTLPTSDENSKTSIFITEDESQELEPPETFAALMAVFFGICFSVEMMLLAGVIWAVQCLIITWLCYSLVIFVFFLGLIVDSIHDWDLVSIYGIVLALHSYCCLIVFSALMVAKSNNGEIIQRGNGPAQFQDLESGGSDDRGQGYPMMLPHSEKAIYDEAPIVTPSAPPPD